MVPSNAPSACLLSVELAAAELNSIIRVSEADSADGFCAGGRRHGYLRATDGVRHCPEGRARMPRVPAAGRRQVAPREGDHRDW